MWTGTETYYDSNYFNHDGQSICFEFSKVPIFFWQTHFHDIKLFPSVVQKVILMNYHQAKFPIGFSRNWMEEAKSEFDVKKLKHAMYYVQELFHPPTLRH